MMCFVARVISRDLKVTLFYVAGAQRANTIGTVVGYICFFLAQLLSHQCTSFTACVLKRLTQLKSLVMVYRD